MPSTAPRKISAKTEPPPISVLRPADFATVKAALDLHARYLGGVAGGRRANFTHLDLSNFMLEGVDLRQAELSGARLCGAFMADAKLEDAVLYGADLRDVDLRRAYMVRADLRGACLRGANLTSADLAECDMREGLIAMHDVANGFRILRHESRKENVNYAVINGANMAGIQNNEGLVVSTDFTDSILAGARLVRAKMHKTMFDGADMTGVDLFQADLQGASLKRAVLVGVDLEAANFDGADMTGVLQAPPPLIYVDDEPLHELLNTHEMWCQSQGLDGKPTRLPKTDFRPLRSLARRKLTALNAAESIFFGMNLEGVQLQGSDLTGVDMRGANLKGADLRGCKLIDADLTRANLSGANLGPLAISDGRYIRADLTRAKMRGADLTGARLNRARMLEADMHGAILTGADLHSAEREV